MNYNKVQFQSPYWKVLCNNYIRKSNNQYIKVNSSSKESKSHQNLFVWKCFKLLIDIMYITISSFRKYYNHFMSYINRFDKCNFHINLISYLDSCLSIHIHYQNCLVLRIVTDHSLYIMSKNYIQCNLALLNYTKHKLLLIRNNPFNIAYNQ